MYTKCITFKKINKVCNRNAHFLFCLSFRSNTCCGRVSLTSFCSLAQKRQEKKPIMFTIKVFSGKQALIRYQRFFFTIFSESLIRESFRTSSYFIYLRRCYLSKGRHLDVKIQAEIYSSQLNQSQASSRPIVQTRANEKPSPISPPLLRPSRENGERQRRTICKL